MFRAAGLSPHRQFLPNTKGRMPSNVSRHSCFLQLCPRFQIRGSCNVIRNAAIRLALAEPPDWRGASQRKAQSDMTPETPESHSLRKSVRADCPAVTVGQGPESLRQLKS